MLRKDPYSRVLRSDPADNWTTITILILAGVLSTLSLQDRGFPILFNEGSISERPWTLLTTSLLHGSYLHMILNLYWAWQFGRVLEPSIGSWNLAWITILFAAGSDGAGFAIEGPAVGFSGVGFAYFGLLWTLDKFHPDARGLLDERVKSFFILWFALCFVLAWTVDYPVANAAHAAGLALGALAGWGLAKGKEDHSWQRWVFVLLALAFCLWGWATEAWLTFPN